METQTPVSNTDLAATTDKAIASDASITDKVKRSAHDAIDKAAETASQAERKLRDTAHTSEQRLRHAGTDIQQVSEKAYGTARTYMREHPIESIGIAFVAGVLVSGLLRR